MEVKNIWYTVNLTSLNGHLPIADDFLERRHSLLHNVKTT